MTLDKGFGEGTIESLDLGVHLGTSWIRMEVDDAFTLEVELEVILELAAVVGLYVGEGYGSDSFEQRHEVGGGANGSTAAVAPAGPGLRRT